MTPATSAPLDAALKAIDYAGFPARKAKAKSEGKPARA